MSGGLEGLLGGDAMPKPVRAAQQPSDPLDVGLGLRIRDRRRSLGLSQLEVADAVGLAFQQIQRYEREGRVAAPDA